MSFEPENRDVEFNPEQIEVIEPEDLKQRLLVFGECVPQWLNLCLY